jgi:uncharacterized protein (TIGR02145 family)
MKVIDHFGLIERLNVSFSEFKDTRDGQIYQTVKIAGVEWFRDNLNFDDTEEFGNVALLQDVFSVEMPSVKVPDSDTCGRLYSFSAAQEACPEGWEIPKREDFIELYKKIAQKDPFNWKDPERAMFFYTFYGKNSIMGVKDCGYYDNLDYTTKEVAKREKKFTNKPGWGHIFTSTSGSLINGGSVFVYRSDYKHGVEDVRYGFYPVRPIRKNI